MICSCVPTVQQMSSIREALGLYQRTFNFEWWTSKSTRIIQKTFIFSKTCLATPQITSFLVIIRLSGRILPTIRSDSRIPENGPESRITGYEPDIRCDPTTAQSQYSHRDFKCKIKLALHYYHCKKIISITKIQTGRNFLILYHCHNKQNNNPSYET